MYKAINFWTVKMTTKESQAINIARFIFVVGVLFIHFPISYSSADGISLTANDTPMYNTLSSPFFLSSTCLNALFLISGYLFFKTLGGGGILLVHMLKRLMEESRV